MSSKSSIKKTQSALKTVLNQYPNGLPRELVGALVAHRGVCKQVVDATNVVNQLPGGKLRDMHSLFFVSGTDAVLCNTGTQAIYPELHNLCWAYAAKLCADKQKGGTRFSGTCGFRVVLSAPDAVVGLLDELLATEGWTAAHWDVVEDMWVAHAEVREQVALAAYEPAAAALRKLDPTKTIGELRTWLLEMATQVGGDGFMEWAHHNTKDEPLLEWVGSPTATFVFNFGTP